MKRIFVLGLMALPVLIFLDLSWTVGIAGKLYDSQLGYLLSTHPQLLPLILFYLVYSFGIAYFVVAPALRTQSWRHLNFSAVLLGLVGYGTYDLVNLGVTANWPLLISVVDIIWGIVITILTSSAVFAVARRIYR